MLNVRCWISKQTPMLECGNAGFDPSPTLVVHRSNGFDARFEPLSQYSSKPIQCWPLSLGADYAAT
jgi:hypothetical protein